MRKIRVGITHGDINGVGYEIILKTFENPEMLELCTPIVYGSPKTATYHRKAIECATNFVVKNNARDADDNMLNVVNCFGEEEIKIDFGQSTPEAGRAALISLERALADYQKELIDVLVTAPINKNNIQGEGFHFPGHTEYIESKVGEGNKSLMILMNDSLRVALATTHLPLSQVAGAIRKDVMEEKIRILNQSLKRDFRIDNPRIAVLALNPHCGDGGLIGTEEQTMIIPTIEQLFAVLVHPLRTDSSARAIMPISMQSWPCITIRDWRPSRL